VEVKLQGCLEETVNEAGQKESSWRLRSLPEQKFGPVAEAAVDPGHPWGIEAPRTSTGNSQGLYGVRGGVTPPVPLNSVEAEYSEEARKAGLNGVCIVSLIVDAQGVPQNPKVVRALGLGLDQKALEAVMKYRFRPAMKNGTPVPVMISVEVNFRLFAK
jgi:TonB family protein